MSPSGGIESRGWTLDNGLASPWHAGLETYCDTAGLEALRQTYPSHWGMVSVLLDGGVLGPGTETVPALTGGTPRRNACAAMRIRQDAAPPVMSNARARRPGHYSTVTRLGWASERPPFTLPAKRGRMMTLLVQVVLFTRNAAPPQFMATRLVKSL